MRNISYSGQFKRDVKRLKKRGKDMMKMQSIIMLLLADKPLPKSLFDHLLKGQWHHCHELHIEPDWLLIYALDDKSIRFERTGSHADLFG